MTGKYIRVLIVPMTSIRNTVPMKYKYRGNIYGTDDGYKQHINIQFIKTLTSNIPTT